MRIVEPARIPDVLLDRDERQMTGGMFLGKPHETLGDSELAPESARTEYILTVPGSWIQREAIDGVGAHLAAPRTFRRLLRLDSAVLHIHRILSLGRHVSEIVRGCVVRT